MSRLAPVAEAPAEMEAGDLGDTEMIDTTTATA